MLGSLAALAALSDPAQAGAWLGILVAGLVFCVAIRRAGVPTTYVRDLLHVGAGSWALGLPLWHGRVAPIAIPLAALVALAALGAAPRAAGRVRALARFRDAVSSGDERFGGLVLYAASFAALSAFAVLAAPEARSSAAAALLALALGDGVGGLVGRRFGRLHFRVPGAKEKSLEGSLAVALFSALALLAIGAWCGRPFGAGSIVAAALAAAVAEAIAPRASDNVLLPAAVFVVLRALA